MEKKISHRKIYRNAPIIEAVINIRVDSAKDPDEESFEKAAKSRFQGKYPVVERQVQTEFRFPIGTKPQFTANEQENPIITQENSVLSWSGLRFSSVDGKQILQIGNNCFSFSRLAPYDRWENFKEEAARLFDLYREITVPSQITGSFD